MKLLIRYMIRHANVGIDILDIDRGITISRVLATESQMLDLLIKRIKDTHYDPAIHTEIELERYYT